MAMRDSPLIIGLLEVYLNTYLVVLYAMLSGTVPFKANNMTDLHKLILKGNYTPIKEISEEATSLISGLLDIDPKKRVKIDQILNHPWLKLTENNGKFKSKSNK
jgi:serine/threonine protein kinase